MHSLSLSLLVYLVEMFQCFLPYKRLNNFYFLELNILFQAVFRSLQNARDSNFTGQLGSRLTSLASVS